MTSTILTVCGIVMSITAAILAYTGPRHKRTSQVLQTVFLVAANVLLLTFLYLKVT